MLFKFIASEQGFRNGLFSSLVHSNVVKLLRSPSADISPERRNMNKLGKLVFAASAAFAVSASAQQITDFQANKPNSAYAQDARGVIVRDPFGLCWRNGYWTPADA